jgi:HD-GYP domain-containing protein (c-di-GMP phosphodiesterase class II)
VIHQPTPPRFVVKTTIAILIMVAFVLSAVFVGVALNVRERVRGAVAERLETGQRLLIALEQRRARELTTQVTTLADNPVLKTSLWAYQVEGAPTSRQKMLIGIERELEKLSERMESDVLAVADRNGNVICAAGRRNADWPLHAAGAPVSLGRHSKGDARHGSEAKRDLKGAAYIAMPGGVFQFATSTLTLGDTFVGTLHVAKAFDPRYAQELSSLSGTGTLIASGDRVVASTLPPDTVRALTPASLRTLPPSAIVSIDGSEHAVKLLFRDGDVAIYAVDSIGASTRVPMQNALKAISIIALGSFALAVFASIWLARTISRPIDRLSRSLSEMTKSRDFDNPVPPTGFSLEVDTLTSTFNTMMQSVSTAEAETRSAYIGAIRALALALDARDPYTAGHSERVSVVSVAVGRQMGLPEDQIEILRLGALMHDIGKIGISDNVLRKPGALTPEEFELIKQHPGVGARILRSVPFFAPQLPIVELHHERPDGQGYPHRLSGEEIPLLARIVHVADAFDAITSARAYRPARGATEALRELWRCTGSQFDTEVVQALASALPSIEVATPADTRSVRALGTPRLTVVGATGRG